MVLEEEVSRNAQRDHRFYVALEVEHGWPYVVGSQGLMAIEPKYW